MKYSFTKYKPCFVNFATDLLAKYNSIRLEKKEGDGLGILRFHPLRFQLTIDFKEILQKSPPTERKYTDFTTEYRYDVKFEDIPSSLKVAGNLNSDTTTVIRTSNGFSSNLVEQLVSDVEGILLIQFIE